MLRVAGEGAIQVGFQGIQHAQPIAGGRVAGLVGEPGKAVQRHQIAAQAAGEQPQGDREVLASGAAQDALGCERRIR
jgi:hypothetical protein